MRKSFSPDFMAKVALSAIKSDMTTAELSFKYEVHRSQINNWRKRALSSGINRTMKNLLMSFTGKLAVKGRDCLTVEEKRGLIDSAHKGLSVRRQCALLDLHRSNIYYKPVMVSDETLRAMNRIDEIFTESPFYGSRRIREALRREGWGIGKERVRSLMRKMGMRAIYPKPKLSKNDAAHSKYPYLLSNARIIRPG